MYERMLYLGISSKLTYCCSLCECSLKATPSCRSLQRFRSLYRSIMLARGNEGSKGDFVAWWRENVMRLAMLAHQYRNGAVGRDKIEQVGSECRVVLAP